MTYCSICDKHNGEIPFKIYESDNIVVSHGPLTSQVKGYFYVEFKRHIEMWTELTEEEICEYVRIIKKVENYLVKRINLERLYSIVISEAVRHIHIHLIPRTKGMSIKGIDLIKQATQQDIISPLEITEEEVLDMLADMRNYL